MDPPIAKRPTQKRGLEREKDIRKKEGKGHKKKQEGKINLKKKRKEKKELFLRSFFEGIRLTTSPCTRSRHAPSKRVLDRLGIIYTFSNYYFT